MGKYRKLIEKIVNGRSDKNIAFNDLCGLLRMLGFEERIRGSHHILRKSGLIELINLQRDNNKAKAYQVRKVRNIILKYNLSRELNA